jgi:hypothetical protein
MLSRSKGLNFHWVVVEPVENGSSMVRIRDPWDQSSYLMKISEFSQNVWTGIGIYQDLR